MEFPRKLVVVVPTGPRTIKSALGRADIRVYFPGHQGAYTASLREQGRAFTVYQVEIYASKVLKQHDQN